MDYTQNVPAFLCLLQNYLTDTAKGDLSLIYKGQTNRKEFSVTTKLLTSLQALLLLEEQVAAALAATAPQSIGPLQDQEAVIISYCLALTDLTSSIATPYGVSLPVITRYEDCGCGEGGSTDPGDGGTPEPVTVTLNGVTETLGGFTPGDYGQLLNQEAWEKLLIKEQFPAYTPPSASLAASRSGLVKKGSLLVVDLQPAFTKGDAGDLTSYQLQRTTGTTTILASDSTPPITSGMFTDNYVAGEEAIQYLTTYNYGQGPLKYSNNNNAAPGRIPSGQVTAAINLQGILPWYYGIAATDTVPYIYGGSEVLALSNGSLVVPSFGSGAAYLWFAVPRLSNGNPQKVFTAWFRSVLDSGVIGGSTNLFRSAVTTSVTSNNLAVNWTRDYDLYFTNYKTLATTATTLS